MAKNQITWESLSKDKTLSNVRMNELVQELMQTSDIYEFIDVGDKKYTPLGIAIINHNYSMLESLLSNGADPHRIAKELRNVPSLALAVNQNRIDLVELLIARGANVDQPNEMGFTPFSIATCIKNLEIARFLIEKKADINKPNNDGNTPLRIAIAHKSDEVIKFLLENGADANIQVHTGATPLYEAAQDGDLNLSKLLLENRADANFQDKATEFTPLFKAVQGDHLDLVKLLIENGAAVNLLLKHLTSALTLAICKGNLEIITILVQNGADVNLSNHPECTPLDILLTRKIDDVNLKKEMVKALLLSKDYPLIIKDQIQKDLVLKVLEENPSLNPFKTPLCNSVSDSDIQNAIDVNYINVANAIKDIGDSAGMPELGIARLIMEYASESKVEIKRGAQDSASENASHSSSVAADIGAASANMDETEDPTPVVLGAVD